MATKHFDIPDQIKQDDIKDDGTFTAYGSTFNGEPDSYGDIIAPGAFSRSIKEGGRNGNGIVMLLQHDPHNPIGVWPSISEDSKGLALNGQINMDKQIGRETHSDLKMGVIKGLSIGFDFYRDSKGRPKSDSYDVDTKNGTRILKQLNLWEVSPVTFPANTRANIVSVKSLESAKSEREFERTLRDLGLSVKDALYITKLCKPGLGELGKLHKKDKSIELNSIMNPILNSLKQINK